MIMEQRIYYSPAPNSNNGVTIINSHGNEGESHDVNKICQWYCCSCGQSYGSIIYRHNSIEEPSSTTPTNHDLHGLKYYSQIVYTNGNYSYSNTEQLLTSPSNDHNHNHHSADNYSHHRNSGNSDLFDAYRETIPSRNSSTSSSGSVASSRFTQTTISTTTQPQHLDNDHEGVILNTPTRFNCHRCNHMMCPYCPKLRLKDLHDKLKR